MKETKTANQLIAEFQEAGQDFETAKKSAEICATKILLTLTPLIPKIQLIWFWETVRDEIRKAEQ